MKNLIILFLLPLILFGCGTTHGETYQTVEIKSNSVDGKLFINTMTWEYQQTNR
jgi:hypothetical protein